MIAIKIAGTFGMIGMRVEKSDYVQAFLRGDALAFHHLFWRNQIAMVLHHSFARIFDWDNFFHDFVFIDGAPKQQAATFVWVSLLAVLGNHR